MKMNPKVKARWVAALRSGEYKQTKSELKDGQGGFCCLGVLCDIYAKDNGRKRWSVAQLSDKADGEFALSYLDQGVPAAVVAIWAGLDYDQEIRIGQRCETLYDHNDDGRTFAEIADAIEAQL